MPCLLATISVQARNLSQRLADALRIRVVSVLHAFQSRVRTTYGKVVIARYMQYLDIQ
jgi:hypothetical protein